MDKNQYLSNELGHEEITIPVLKSLNKNLFIFDIGSCDGLDSLRYNLLFTGVTIHAFEANLKNFRLLCDNARGYKNIVTNNIALADKSGELIFYDSYSENKSEDWDHGNKSGSLLVPKEHLRIFSGIKFCPGAKVQTITLDQYCEQNQIAQVHLMHIDVQGAEKLVLEGAKSILKQTVFVWLEASNIELYENQPLKEDILSLLKGHDFLCVLDKVGSKSYGDLLFFNKRFFKVLSNRHYIFLFWKKLLNGLFPK